MKIKMFYQNALSLVLGKPDKLRAVFKDMRVDIYRHAQGPEGARGVSLRVVSVDHRSGTVVLKQDWIEEG